MVPKLRSGEHVFAGSWTNHEELPLFSMFNEQDLERSEQRRRGRDPSCGLPLIFIKVVRRFIF